MNDEDLADVSMLQLSRSRDPRRWIEWNRRNYADLGFGLWLLETHSGQVVGDCGLTVQEVEGARAVEVGWHVKPSLQGQGFATEAARAVRAAATEAGVDRLVAIIVPDNLASQRVATKIGLVLDREINKNGRAALVYGASLRRE